MRATQTLIATVKETPADAEVISHQLMLRAGLIRRLASGLYTWLPMGLKVLRKVERIVREEMDASGAQEVLMPAVQPGELWQESGRWEQYGPELLRLKDRHDREFCIGPTHEEVITDLMRREVKSYKQLPINFYQVQTKFRDEIRPRFGVMRSREFIMKDGYSFHIDQDSLVETYNVMYDTYTKIFDRLGLDYRAVIADNGSIGGTGSHEFHVLADSGEDDIAFSDTSSYAANIEMAEALTPGGPAEPSESMRLVDTPAAKTIEQLVEQFELPIERTVKTLVVKAAPDCETPYVALILRGDHQLNEVKAEKIPEVAEPLEMATEEEIRKVMGAGPGSLGPINCPIDVIIDRAAAACSDFGAGANIDDKHYFGINWGRDVSIGKVADLRTVVAGDLSPDGQGKLSIRRGIEVGHIFQLGLKYSQAMNATVLDEQGKAKPMAMGCYGIGVTRIVAAAIEQNHDERGIIWPAALAPFSVVLVALQYDKSERVKETADRLYEALKARNIDVLLDDRKERPGVKFADMELMGIPHRLVVSDRGIEAGQLEYKGRKDAENSEISLEQAVDELIAKLS